MPGNAVDERVDLMFGDDQRRRQPDDVGGGGVDQESGGAGGRLDVLARSAR